MRLPVVYLCEVRKPEDEWRDRVDRGARLPRAFPEKAYRLLETLRY